MRHGKAATSKQLLPHQRPQLLCKLLDQLGPSVKLCRRILKQYGFPLLALLFRYERLVRMERWIKLVFSGRDHADHGANHPHFLAEQACGLDFVHKGVRWWEKRRAGA